LIPCLASLDRVAPSPRWIEMARACGDRLLERALKSQRGVGWLTRVADRRPATGFSHGAAGIGWALFELAELAGDDRYAEIGLQAFEYEATQFDAAQANWLDPEGQAKTGEARDSTLMMAWCYGAPGIGLARLRSISRPGARRLHARIARDVEIAVRSTLERGFGRNHCLCHGDLGNLDFLVHAARALNDGGIEEAWRRKAAGVLASIETGGVLCGMPLGIESVALMNGLAGIGFGLLRLAEPDRVPSVLALEAPPR
jgi:lantibiotic modifying enzyme